MNKMPNIVIFSFFSGVGILDLAFEKNGYEIVFVNEYESCFMEAYEFSRKNLQIKEPRLGYSNKSALAYTKGKNKQKLMRIIQEEKAAGNIVGFIGGPPCPDFSVGGKNRGASGINGRLTKTYFDLIVRCKPDFFLFENVKGLVKTEKHKIFYNEMKMKVTHSGYVISDKIVNALSYGVPQFRERILMVGFCEIDFRRKGELNVDEKNCFNFPWEKYKQFDIDKVLSFNWPIAEEFKENSERDFVYDVPESLTVEYWFKRNNVTEHPNQNKVFAVKEGLEKMKRILEGDTKRKSFKRLHRWKYSPTAAYGNNEVHLHPYKVRRLSVAEAMAIQSLPEKFILPSDISLTAMFKMIGNGVPYLMAECIARTLKELIQQVYDM